MSGFIWFVAALIATVALAYGRFKRRQVSEPVSAWELSLLLLPIAVLASVFLVSGDRSDRIHLTWSAMEFPIYVGESVSFGGSFDQDNVYLPDFPDRAFVVERIPVASGPSVVGLRREQPSVLVTLGTETWGYRTLTDGATVELPHSDGSLREVTFHDGGWLKGAMFEGPAGRAEFMTRDLNQNPGSADIVAARLGKGKLDGRPLHLGLMTGEPDCSELHSFVYRRHQGLGWEYRVALVDTGATIKGQRSEPMQRHVDGEAERLLRSDGLPVTLTPTRCMVSDSGTTAASGRSAAFRLQLSEDGNRLKVILSDPVRFSFARKLLTQEGRPALPELAALVVSSIQQATNAVNLSGDRVLVPIGFSQRLSSAMGALRETISRPAGVRVETPAGQADVHWGEQLTLGTDARIVLQTYRVGLPWDALLVITALTGCMLIVGFGQAVSYSLLALTAPTIFLLAMRVLLAYRIFAAYPSSPSVMPMAITATMLVLAMLLACASVGAYAPRLGFANRAGVLRRYAGVIAIGAPLYCLSVRIIGVQVPFSALFISAVSVGVFFLALAAPAVARGFELLDSKSMNATSFKILLTGFGLIWIVRVFVAVVFGWREAIWVGQSRLALSMLWTPVSVLFTAVVVYRLEKRIQQCAAAGTRSWRPFIEVLLSLALFVVWHIASVVASDSGSLVVDLPASLLVLVGIAGVSLRGFRWHGAPVLILPFASVAVLLMFPRLVAAPIETFLSSRDDPLSVDRSPAYYRLLATLDRKKLESIGTLGTEGLRLHYAIAQANAASTAAGHGYLGSELPRVGEGFLASLMSDNTMAMLVSPDWGVGGYWGVCLLLLCLPLAIVGAGAGVDRMTALVQLAAIAYFVYGALYMVGANTYVGASSLLPFTGRNLHLLNATSGSDAVEAAALLGLMAIMAGRRK